MSSGRAVDTTTTGAQATSIAHLTTDFHNGPTPERPHDLVDAVWKPCESCELRGLGFRAYRGGDSPDGVLTKENRLCEHKRKQLQTHQAAQEVVQLRMLTCELLAQVVGRGQHRPGDHLAEKGLGSGRFATGYSD